ncbi:hypothetical protein WAI453_003968 [Rhynchosporium graminicola]
MSVSEYDANAKLEGEWVAIIGNEKYTKIISAILGMNMEEYWEAKWAEEEGKRGEEAPMDSSKFIIFEAMNIRGGLRW